jgi:enoyl-CoA hydratase
MVMRLAGLPPVSTAPGNRNEKGAITSMAEPATFRRSEDDGVLTFTFTRDAKLNAVSPVMIDGLRAAVDDLGDRDDLKVLVLAAEGRYFTAGIDLSDSGAGGRRGYAADGSYSSRRQRRGSRGFHLLMDELEAIEKPSVLAVHARCLGVGLEIGASCDFRLAADGASFALPELPNLGVIPGSGGISRVTRLVGPHWGKWLAFGEEVSAELALTMGLVHAVYPAESFRERVTAFARKLAALPSEAAGAAKIAVDVAASVDRGTARDFDRYANSVLLSSDEHRSMLAAFTNRRRPTGDGAAPDQGKPDQGKPDQGD